jgi:hydroxymethylglutaryl-CoA lyase
MPVTITEVGMRDGLQREPHLIPTADKLQMIHDLVAAGIRSIQVTSFVHPARVPQMADAELLCQQLQQRPDVVYSGLVLNLKGLERAQQAGLRAVDISISASDHHSRRNANLTLEQAMQEFEIMVRQAHALNLQVRAGIQCAFGFYGDDVRQPAVIELVRMFLAQGIGSLSLADSTGMAHPYQIRAMLNAVLPLLGSVPLILHLHDTRGMGLANVLAGLEAGCRHFDTAFGGMGGCNFIEDAAGNIPTEDTINMLHAMGYQTGVDLGQVAAVSRHLQKLLGRALPGKLYQLGTY